MTVLLVDGDVIVYTAAFHVARKQKESEETGEPLDHPPDKLAEYKIDNTISACITATGATSYKVYLTGKGNFRYAITKTYKEHRKAEKPLLFDHCRNHIQFSHNAIVSNGEEADDLIAIEAARMGYEGCVITSIDKDFLQVPVPMYNWKRGELTPVSEVDGIRFFYQQCLEGDRADNVEGIKGVGPKTALKWLEGLGNEKDLYKTVLEKYKGAGMTEQDLTDNARLLWLRREPDEMWEPPTL